MTQIRSAERQHLSPGLAQTAGDCLCDHGQLAGVADHYASALHPAGLASKTLMLAHLGDGDLSRGSPGGPLEGLNGGPPHHAVVGKADVLLELPDRSLRPRPQDPVNPVRVEAELTEATLQLRHIVASHHRGSVVEKSVSESMVGLHEGAPRLWTADAVDHQAAVALELAQRRFGRGAEFLIVPAGAVADQRQPALKIANGLSSITASQRQPPGLGGCGHAAIRGTRQARPAEPPSAWLPPLAWPALRH